MKKHLKDFLGQEMDVFMHLHQQRKYAEIDKRLLEINLSRLAYRDQSDKYCIYYFLHSHNLYHIFVHGLLIINMFAFREYLHWRLTKDC